MLKRLAFSVTFPSTGKVLSGTHEFEGGLTAITGPNGKGKSLRLEMIRYGLFGTKALRGDGSDYRGLRVELTLEVNEVEYHILRSSNRTVLSRGDEELAVGTTAVNAKIIQILGFDLSVFDIACSINQGEVEALSNMRPADRKRMVDQTIGLSKLEETARWCLEQARDGNVRADTLREQLREPIKPDLPEGYVGSDVERTRLQEAQAIQHQIKELEGWLSHVRAKPSEPVAPCQETAIFLAEHQRVRSKTLTFQNDALKALAKLGPEPKGAQADVDQMEKALLAWDSWQERQKLEARRLHLLSHGHHRCPSCEHEWPIETDQLQELDAVLATSSDTEPIKPAFTWRDHQLLVQALASNQQRVLHQAKLEETEKTLEAFPDRSQDLAARRVYENQVASYEVEAGTFTAWEQERDQKRLELVRLQGDLPDVKAIEARLHAATVYELSLRRFQEETVKFDALVGEIKEVDNQVDQWRRAKRAIDDARAKIKAHLVPSLNKVASHLLLQMTAGKMVKIEVDEDFDVKVDGQPIHTLSGSEKAVANLALRVGLGQVLTSRLFSVLLADEIDASMDDERAEATAECIRGLSKSLDQILLVSHKSPSADHHVQL